MRGFRSVAFAVLVLTLPGCYETEDVAAVVVPSAGVVEFQSVTFSVAEGGATATITVLRNGGTFGSVSVDYASSDGSATAGVDYNSSNGNLAWADGDSAAKTFTVDVTQDADVEGDETLVLTLSLATGGATIGSGGAATLTITDDDSANGVFQFSAATYSVSEAGATATINVTRTGGSVGAVSVDYGTSDSTATAGADYTTTSGTLNWADGDAGTKAFNIPILQDVDLEAGEDVNLFLGSPTGGAVVGTQGTAVLTITDDDSAGTLNFSTAAYNVSEAGVTATITVTRTGGNGGAIGVTYATSNGSATAGSDYTTTTNTLSWIAGDSADKTFTVDITEDLVVEGNETVNLALSLPTGGAVLGATSTSVLTILDNDAAGTLQFSSATYSVNESALTVTITVTRTGGSTGAVSVNYATSAGTANGADYTAASGTLSWTDGDTASKTFNVAIKNNDNQAEGDETVNLALTGPTGGATLGTPSTAVLTIIND